VIGLPNHLHLPAVRVAAAAKKAIVCTKPLARNGREAAEIVRLVREAGVMHGYAETEVFSPDVMRARQMIESGAIGEVLTVRAREAHSGPHAPHFWDVNRSGGGVTMDMGCHAIEFFRWMLGRPPIKSVYAQLGTYVHQAKTEADDNAILLIEFANGVIGLAEESWTKLGGMDDRAEVHGSKGVAYADVLHGNAIQTYSAEGYDYAVEKAGSTKGWSFTIYEEEWNYGFPQELAHFVDCVKNDKQPLVTGEDARAVMEVLFAAYESAGSGRKVKLPFKTDARKPFDLWRGGKSSR